MTPLVSDEMSLLRVWWRQLRSCWKATANGHGCPAVLCNVPTGKPKLLSMYRALVPAETSEVAKLLMQRAPGLCSIDCFAQVDFWCRYFYMLHQLGHSKGTEMDQNSEAWRHHMAMLAMEKLAQVVHMCAHSGSGLACVHLLVHLHPVPLICLLPRATSMQ